MVTYTLKGATRQVYDWLCDQPNQITSPEMAGGTITASFNHNIAEALTFKVALNKMQGGDSFKVDGVDDLLTNYMEKLMSDQFIFGTESQQTKTNIGTSYVNIFPAAINGNPIPIDTTGFTKLGVQLFWNKNGGTTNHDFRIVNDANVAQVAYEKTNITTTETRDFNVALNGNFTNFIGFLRIQGKAGNATDDPIFLGLRLYLRR